MALLWQCFSRATGGGTFYIGNVRESGPVRRFDARCAACVVLYFLSFTDEPCRDVVRLPFSADLHLAGLGPGPPEPGQFFVAQQVLGHGKQDPFLSLKMAAGGA